MPRRERGRRAVQAWHARLQELRYRGFGGWKIQPHRAIFQIPLERANIAVAILLPLAFNLAQLLLLDQTLGIWRLILGFWNAHLDLEGVPGERVFDLGYVLLSIPQLEIAGNAPGAVVWLWTLVACVAIFAATFHVPAERLLPAVYAARACLAIQASALACFYWLPGSFPYDLESYIGTNLFSSLVMLLLIPWLLGLTYYIFDFPVLQKIALTALILGFFVIAIPMQYLFHAYVVKNLSLLFLPILYIVSGMFLDVLMLIALYSWGMRWRVR